jgi:hypothetical protein
MIQMRTRKETVTAEGIKGRLVFHGTMPFVNGHERISSFYERIEEACLEYCQRELFKKISSERGDMPWEVRYRLSLAALCTDSALEITLAVTLYDTVAHKTLASHTEKHLWSCEDERMLTPRKVKKLTKSTQKT